MYNKLKMNTVIKEYTITKKIFYCEYYNRIPVFNYKTTALFEESDPASKIMCNSLCICKDKMRIEKDFLCEWTILNLKCP